MNSPDFLTDVHFHTPRSDGQIECVDLAQMICNRVADKSYSIIAVPCDHDYISRFCKKGLGDSFHSCYGAEVTSICNIESAPKYLHLAYYSQAVNPDIKTELKSIRKRKKISFIHCLEGLKDQHFSVSIDDFLQKQESIGGSKRNINRFQIAQYVLSIEANRQHASNLSRAGGDARLYKSDVMSAIAFLNNFIKKSGKYSNIKYEDLPDIGLDANMLGEIAHENKDIVCLVHPHVTFRGNIDVFLNTFPKMHKKFNIEAIEIPTTANLQWIQVIMRIAERHDLIITFGSDYHGYEPDDTHGNLLSMNSHVPQEYVNHHSEIFRDRFCH